MIELPISASVQHVVDGGAMLRAIEAAGRTCYKSEDRITDDSAAKFVSMLIRRGHHAMLEFGGDITVRFVVPRGISHELVRHRLASYAQESTRYCDYTGGDIAFIRPWHLVPWSEGESLWIGAMQTAENQYRFARNVLGWKPEQARGLLPLDLKTEVIMKANPREWRHFFSLRASPPAHPQMRIAACCLLRDLRRIVPVLFDDVGDVDCAPVEVVL